MKTQFKEPLTLERMTEYLHETKNVVYERISEKKAQKYLYELSYVNLIRPFKHYFQENGTYRVTDFQEYLDHYDKEREIYPTIYKNIMKLEGLLKSILSYEILNAYRINSFKRFQALASTLTQNAKRTPYNDSIKSHMYRIIEKMEDEIQDYHSPHALLGELTLKESLSLLYTLDEKLKNHCRQEILNRQTLIQERKDNEFYEEVDRIIQIRNCICHNDSLESLIYYSREEYEQVRDPQEKQLYLDLLNRLTN